MPKEEKTERARQILSYNLDVLKTIREYKYPYLYWYLYKLERGELFGYTEKLLLFVLARNCFPLYRNQFRFFLDTTDNSIVVRGRGTGSNKTSFHLIKLLCALGVIRNVKQNKDVLMDLNKIIQQDKLIHQNKREKPVNFYAYRKLTGQRLREIERRAKRLYGAEVTKTNISYCYLGLNDCMDIATEVYPNNSPKAIEKKEREYIALLRALDEITARKGYATKQEISKAAKLKKMELENLLKDTKRRWSKLYRYGRPTNVQKSLYGIPKRRNSHIYTKVEVIE